MSQTVTRADIAGLVACLPHELGETPRPSTMVVCVLREQRVVQSLTFRLVDALDAGAPDVLVEHVHQARGDAVVVVAYHEATIDTVATIATHLAMAFEHRGVPVVGVAQVGLVTDTWRRMTGWADDDKDPVSGRYSDLAQHPALAALVAQDREVNR